MHGLVIRQDYDFNAGFEQRGDHFALEEVDDRGAVVS
jgi:hypothetical protein